MIGTIAIVLIFEISIMTVYFHYLGRVLPLLDGPVREALRTVRDAMTLNSVDPDFPTLGVWTWAAFFASAWAAVYLAAGGVVRTMGAALSRAVGFLNVDERPLTSLGWVAMLLVSVVYWAVAAVVWAAG
jgi:hypothetical protein